MIREMRSLRMLWRAFTITKLARVRLLWQEVLKERDPAFPSNP